ncbi:MAG TPA: dATP/dGTP diphosphohydrolase domain-containing protein [Nitrososphaeraceae archaeon]|nr:dATP/dGTP diphosphohydrolase domain-containing protein [Nitrososphaeraceae archaeon]
MKTQGDFKYTINGENKTKEEIDNMDLSSMNCTVDGLSVLYSFSRDKNGLANIPIKSENFQQKSLEDLLNRLSGSPKKETIRTKTEEILNEVERHQQEVNGGILKGEEFPYDFPNNSFNSIEDLTKDNVITNSNGGENDIIIRFKKIDKKDDSEKILITEDVRFSNLRDVEKYGKDNNYYMWHNLGRVPDYDEYKDDVITKGNRAEKEMTGYFNKDVVVYDVRLPVYGKVDRPIDANFHQFGAKENETEGIKETEGKLDYSEINFRLLDLMAKRFMDNKVKYPKGNSKKLLDKNEILWAAFRHIRKMIQPIENDPESYEEHLSAILTNMSIILDQLDLEKSK